VAGVVPAAVPGASVEITNNNKNNIGKEIDYGI
jgi:hypothetical protein